MKTDKELFIELCKEKNYSLKDIFHILNINEETFSKALKYSKEYDFETLIYMMRYH